MRPINVLQIFAASTTSLSEDEVSSRQTDKGSEGQSSPGSTESGLGELPVTIKDRVFEPIKELGRGSFGVVWEVVEATADGGQVLAIKMSKSSQKVLQQLQRELPSEVVEGNFVPRYVAHCKVSVNGNTQVLLAMSKLNGVPLDKWLYGKEGQELLDISSHLSFADWVLGGRVFAR
eukprot:Skav201368  [mRNA]  locus=scaffold176:297387:304203:- [translate_table: standard]